MHTHRSWRLRNNKIINFSKFLGDWFASVAQEHDESLTQEHDKSRIEAHEESPTLEHEDFNRGARPEQSARRECNPRAEKSNPRVRGESTRRAQGESYDARSITREHDQSKSITRV